MKNDEKDDGSWQWEVDRLRAERDAALARAANLQIELNARQVGYHRAESEAAALRAEVERLELTRRRYMAMVDSLEARLAAAEALLRRVGTVHNPDDEEITAYFQATR
jgi:phage shock protein A